MTVPEDDLDRIERDYVRDNPTSVDEIEQDLEAAGFDSSNSDPETLAAATGAANDVAADREALIQAQQQAVESVGSGGAVSSDLVRAEPEDGGPPKTIGSPENVEQRIERTGPTSGDVIARNTNTGTEGKIGEVDLPDSSLVGSPEGS